MAFISELNWRPTIGDPVGSPSPLTHSELYWLRWRAGGKTGGNSKVHGQRNWLWLAVAVVMAGLCINKQLDLQSLFTDIGRVIARHQGWFIWRYREFWTNHKLLRADHCSC